MPEDRRSRGYCLTINNYDDEMYTKVLHYDRCCYCIVGKEVGKENSTPHLQVYMRFKNGMRWASLKKDFPEAHIEAAIGSPEQNIKYCSKDGNFEEVGNRPGTDHLFKGMMDALEYLRCEQSLDGNAIEAVNFIFLDLCELYEEMHFPECCVNDPDAVCVMHDDVVLRDGEELCSDYDSSLD